MLHLDRHTPSPGSPELVRRVGWGAAGIAFAFLILVGRLWQLQVVRGDQYHQRSTDNFVHEQKLPAVRGLIKDRRGVVMVDNRPAFSIFAVPRLFDAEVRARLVTLLDLTRAERDALEARLAKAAKRGQSAPVLILDDVSQDRVALVEQASAELPGVSVRDAPHRNYVSGTLAAHVLGYMNLVTAAELEAHPEDEYEDGDYIGRYGLEKEWENYLRGKKGKELYVVDAKNRRKSDEEAAELIEGERYVPAVPGHNLVLTIDVELQRVVERAMRSRVAGGVAVIDVHSGRILALYSKPSFDPNVMTGRLTRDEEAAMLADPLKPFLDKTLRQHYYPGSTYKFVTALAGLDSGLTTDSETVVCGKWYRLGGHTFRCTKVHKIVDLAAALAQSCNVYFWMLAERVGMDRIGKIAREFGFGAPTGLGMNGDVPGRVPWKAWYDDLGGFRIGYTLNTSVGQGDTEVTVLQLALAYAAIANGGVLYLPQLVERVETAEGELVADYPPRERRRVAVSQWALAAVRRGLWGTVNAPGGTAYESRLATIEVAGKTGTAQVRKLQAQVEGVGWDPKNDHAWFAGYAPAENPEIAIVVLVEHGGKGGHVAAPVAMDIVRGYYEQVVPDGRPTRVVTTPLPGLAPSFADPHEGGVGPLAPTTPEDPEAVDDDGTAPHPEARTMDPSP